MTLPWRRPVLMQRDLRRVALALLPVQRLGALALPLALLLLQLRPMALPPLAPSLHFFTLVRGM